MRGLRAALIWSIDCEFPDALKVGSHALRCDKLAVLAFAANIKADEPATLFINSYVKIAPTKVSSLGRSHAGVRHHQHEVVGHGSIPKTALRGCFFDPAPSKGMQVTILLRREFLAPSFAGRQVAGRHLAFPDV